MSPAHDGRERDARKQQMPVTPSASCPELADWVERLFDDEFPQKLCVVEVHGRSGQLVRGDVLESKEFKQNQKKPNKEEHVAISNKFLAAAQRNCDMRRRPQNYVVEAYNEVKSAYPYSQFPLPLEPDKRYQKALDKDGKPAPDDDENAEDPRATDKLLQRFKEAMSDARQDRQTSLTAIGQVFEVLDETNKGLRDLVDKLMERWIKATESMEEARSGQHQRDMEIRKQDFWLKQVADGAHLVKGLLPPLVNRVVGQQVVPATKTPESLVLDNFVGSLTDEQVEKLFGRYSDDPEPKPLAPGIFTVRQAYLIDAVRRCQVDPRNLTKLVLGEDAISPQQLQEAQAVGLTTNQMIPLQALFKDVIERAAKEKEATT